MKYNLGDKLIINGTVFTVMDEGNQVKPTLSEIISKGQARIHDAVEAVIAKYEGEIKKIEDYTKAEKESSLLSIARNGTCSTLDHHRRMDALMGNDHQRQINMLMTAENRARGVAGVGFGNATGLQGIGASQLSAGGWL